jgi:hypothetical protein
VGDTRARAVAGAANRTARSTATNIGALRDVIGHRHQAASNIAQFRVPLSRYGPGSAPVRAFDIPGSGTYACGGVFEVSA